MNATTPAQTLAEQVRDHMWARDAATQALKMTIDAIAPGSATISMPVQAHMLNGHATCHGGYVTLLADSAFAYACNSYNEVTVASGLTIDFLAPSKLNDVLCATAREVHARGRTGVYDVEVRNQRGEAIAVFRGRSYRMKGQAVLPPAPSAPSTPSTPAASTEESHR